MTSAGLTPAQRTVLDFIVRYVRAHRGVSPSFEQIRRELKLSSRGRVSVIVTALRDRGHVTFIPHRARSIALVDKRGADMLASYALPESVEAALVHFCLQRGEDASAVVSDAVALYLDNPPVVDETPIGVVAAE